MRITARDWCRNNGYLEAAGYIDTIMGIWEKRGVKTRRNWWMVLAGGKTGKPVTVEGFQFPVIKAVRKRMGLDRVKDAVANSKKEKAPKIQPQKRWEGRDEAN